tara:strand:+ start:85 stop:516 length:432 start_codon:yes stop_codon:yes gene_type:complete
MSSQYTKLLELIDDCKEKINNEDYFEIMKELKKLNDEIYYKITYDIAYSFTYYYESCCDGRVFRIKHFTNEDEDCYCKYVKGYNGDENYDFDIMIDEIFNLSMLDYNLDLGGDRIQNKFLNKIHIKIDDNLTKIIVVKSIEKC